MGSFPRVRVEHNYVSTDKEHVSGGKLQATNVYFQK